MRRFGIPVATTGLYSALVALSAWIGNNTDWDESPVAWALYIVPHVALGIVGAVSWRWAPALIVIPVGLAIPYTDFGCEGLECIGQPLVLFVLFGVGVLVGIGLLVGVIARAGLQRRRS